MYSSKKHSLINVPRTMRPLCKFQRRAGGCKNVNCLFRHENRVPYTPPSIDVKCDAEEAKKLKAIYEQSDIFYPKENRCPNIPFVPKDNAYRKTNTREKAELQMKLREKKLEEILSSFAADMENLAK